MPAEKNDVAMLVPGGGEKQLWGVVMAPSGDINH